MDTHDSQNTTCRCGADEASQPSLARRLRLVSRLMRAEMRKTIEARPTRGEVTAAARAVEERAADALSPEELTTVLAALDTIARAFGGPDALPFHERGRRGPGRSGRGFGSRSFGHRLDYDAERRFGPHRHHQEHRGR